MLVAFNRMVHAPVRFSAKQSGWIKDLWCDPRTGHLRFVQVDVGGWLTRDEALVGASRLASPVTTGGSWHLDMTEEEVEAAPRCPDAARNAMADWPPILVGPFGTTLSLPLIGAQLSVSDKDKNDAAPEVTQALDCVSGMRGKPVFATDGEMGDVDDIWINVPAGEIHSLAVTTPDPARPVHVRWNQIRHRDADHGHFVIEGVGADYTELHTPAT